MLHRVIKHTPQDGATPSECVSPLGTLRGKDEHLGYLGIGGQGTPADFGLAGDTAAPGITRVLKRLLT